MQETGRGRRGRRENRRGRLRHRTATHRAALTVLLVAVALAGAVWSTAAVLSSSWTDRTLDRVTAVLTLVPAWLLPVVGAALLRWRPRSRSGYLTVLLGGVWSAWTALAASPGAPGTWFPAVLMWVRPLTFWLLLSWPSGRLRRGDRRWIAAITVATVVIWFVVPLLFSTRFDASVIGTPILTDAPELVATADSVSSMLLLPAGAAALAVSSLLAYRRLPATGRYLAAPVLVAGLVVAAWDITLPIFDQMGDLLRDTDGNWTLLGSAWLTADVLRFAALAVLLGVSARRIHRLAGRAEPVRLLDLGERTTPPGFAAMVARAFPDQSVRVALRSAAGRWLGPDGAPLSLGGSGMSTTVIERAGTPIAAVELPTESPQPPSLLDAVVAAAGATVDMERLEALARERGRVAASARRALLRAEDETAQRIQRDLHDGAQQRLVGLMLQARLDAATLEAEDPASMDEVEAQEALGRLAEGIDTTRAELWSLVDKGYDPTADRDLRTAIEDLASTVPIPTGVSVDLPGEIPDDVRTAAWFVAAEATTNALKHAGAERLEITGRVERDHLVLTVADDGIGNLRGPGSGLAGLRHRVEGAGGRLDLESSPGHGTTVVALLPLGAAA